ncbi:MAG: transglutaminase domain-containing protein [Lachnospiraceae bacterium]|nr:transglutaminase domain-containing protein [Lachnospiraceae bacterium]
MKIRKNILLLFCLLFLLPAVNAQAAGSDSSSLAFLKGAHVVAKESDQVSVSSSMSTASDTSVSTSSATKTQAVNKIYQALSSFKKTVDLSEYKIVYSDKTASSLLDTALDKDLYLFNVLANKTDFSEESEFCACYTNGNYIDSFEFQYNAKASSLQAQYKKLKATVSKIQTSLNLEQASREEIVLKVHDYIALHTDYNMAKTPARSSYTACGVLMNGKAVCSGYATAYQLLLYEYGISSEIATSEKMDHAWNLVKLGSKWYHVDVTWDDPYPEQKNYVTYWFFLKTDKEFKNHSVSKHYSWESDGIKCTSKRYSKLPLSDNKNLFYYDSNWYYNSKNSSGSTYQYYKYNFTFTNGTRIATSSIPFVKYGSRIYFASKPYRIASINIDGTIPKTVKTVSTKRAARLSSMKISKNKINYTYYLKGKKKKGTVRLTTALKNTAS